MTYSGENRLLAMWGTVDLIEEDDAPMVENPGIDVVYADGVADVEIVGDNVRVTYFAIRRVMGQRVKCPVLEMVRPLKSCARARLDRIIEKKLETIGPGRRGH